jgi:hypothetical protein
MNLRRILSWVAVLLGGGFLCLYGFWSGAQHMSDFSGYYTSSRILVTSDSVSRMYDGKWFVDRMHQYGIPDSTLLMYVNPPQVAVVMTPLVWMKPSSAKIVWNMINIVLLLIAFELLRRLFDLPPRAPSTPLMAALMVCTLPFFRNLQRGQLYVLMLVLLILFVEGYLGNKPFIASLSLAALLLLKFFGWMFLLLFIVERRWKELAVTSLLVFAGFVLGLLIFGVDTYKAYFDVLSGALRRTDFAFTGLPCVPAFFGALFTFHPQWNWNPVDNIPLVSSLLTMASLTILIILTFQRTPRKSFARISAMILLSVLFTPLAADHHYMLLLLPASYFVVKTDLLQSDQSTLLVLAIVLYLVLGWYPLPKASALAGWTKLFAFPRLFASLLLLSFFLRQNQSFKQGLTAWR